MFLILILFIWIWLYLFIFVIFNRDLQRLKVSYFLVSCFVMEKVVWIVLSIKKNYHSNEKKNRLHFCKDYSGAWSYVWIIFIIWYFRGRITRIRSGKNNIEKFGWFIFIIKRQVLAFSLSLIVISFILSLMIDLQPFFQLNSTTDTIYTYISLYLQWIRSLIL